jgi:hypothetical protein
MSSASLEQVALITREAYSALLHVKTLVESASNDIREAERETVGLAIDREQRDDPVTALRSATETLQSPEFQAAISEARAKIETAVSCLLSARKQ